MAELSKTPAETARKFVGDASRDLKDDEIKRSFNTWASMLARCLVPGHHHARNYAARGISVCERWFLFSNFVADMGPRHLGMSLDRIDNNGNYEPGNCRWADRKTQARNTRNTKRISHEGEMVVQADLALRAGLSESTIMRRHALGLTGDALISRESRQVRKLCASDVDRIRIMCADGIPDTHIAPQFFISHTSVRNIRTGATWRTQ